ncbi:MAG: hypothetical protein JJ966_02295 [Balneolaceae bacterium]|nr:hypothetical protein [Balneolaceae bacterium]
MVARIIVGIFFLITAFNFGNEVQAQFDQGQLMVESRIYAPISSGKLPFWMWANQRGKVNEEGINAIQDFTYRPLDYSKGAFNIESGMDVTLSNGVDHSLNISQLYADLTYKKVGAKVGRFFQTQGLNDGELAIGSMMKSRNAGALIGASAGTTQFNSFPLAQGYFRYHVGISHFWFEDDRYVENALLHSKFLYLQIDLSPLKLTGGIVHNAMWGGVSPDVGQMPQSFNDYLRVIFAQGAGNDTNVDAERTNALGNSIAAYDYGILWDSERIDMKITRLFYIEDIPGVYYRSGWDGQWSFDLLFKNRPFVSRIRYDYVYTIRQDSKVSQPDGRADYYHHYIYQSGWTNQGYVIGMPLITFDEATNTITNNVLVAQSFGLELTPSYKTSVQLLATYSRNYGTCDDILIDENRTCLSKPKILLEDAHPRNTLQNNILSTNIIMSYQYAEHLSFTLSLGFDSIEMGKNRTGIGIGIRYTIWPSNKSE